MDGLRDWAALCKPHLSLFIALSAVLGHGFSGPGLNTDSLVLGLGVWALASGAAMLNNVQDRTYDAGFKRTRTRALVKGRISPSGALALSLLLITGALFFLYIRFDGNGPWLLGGLGVVCYNGWYTPLKKFSLWALVPGVVCGMLPPAMGWTAVPWAMDHLDLSRLFWLMAVLGSWQVPHFLVIQARQSNTDRGRAFPALVRGFSSTGLDHQVFVWTSLYSLSLFIFLLHHQMVSSGAAVAVGLNALVLPLVVGTSLFLGRRREQPLQAFCHHAMIFSLFCFMAAGFYDRLMPFPAG